MVFTVFAKPSKCCSKLQHFRRLLLTARRLHAAAAACKSCLCRGRLCCSSCGVILYVVIVASAVSSQLYSARSSSLKSSFEHMTITVAEQFGRFLQCQNDWTQMLAESVRVHQFELYLEFVSSKCLVELYFKMALSASCMSHKDQLPLCLCFLLHHCNGDLQTLKTVSCCQKH